MEILVSEVLGVSMSTGWIAMRITEIPSSSTLQYLLALSTTYLDAVISWCNLAAWFFSIWWTTGSHADSCGWANVSKAFDTVVGDASSADPTGLQDQARHVGFCRFFFFKPIKGLYSFNVKPLKMVQVGDNEDNWQLYYFPLEIAASRPWILESYICCKPWWKSGHLRFEDFSWGFSTVLPES